MLLAKSSSYSMLEFSTPPPLKADLAKGVQAGGGGAEKKVLDICSPHGILFVTLLSSGRAAAFFPTHCEQNRLTHLQTGLDSLGLGCRFQWEDPSLVDPLSPHPGSFCPRLRPCEHHAQRLRVPSRGKELGDFRSGLCQRRLNCLFPFMSV